MNPEHHISVAELKALLESQSELQLIDVRSPEKHQQINIGGINIPMPLLATQLDKIDRNIPIVTYCTLGNSSMRALEFLVMQGFKNVKSLDGGVTEWFS